MTGPELPEDAFDVRREPEDGWPTIIRLPLLPSPDEMTAMRDHRARVDAEMREQRDKAVHGVTECAAMVGRAGAALDNAVQAARAAGVSWSDIGAAVGISRQAATERWNGR